MIRYRIKCTRTETYVVGDGHSSWTFTFLEKDAFLFAKEQTAKDRIRQFLSQERYLVIEPIEVTYYFLYNTKEERFVKKRQKAEYLTKQIYQLVKYQQSAKRFLSKEAAEKVLKDVFNNNTDYEIKEIT